jgi:hypothetical protein
VSFPNPRKNPQQQIDCTRYGPDPDFKNGEMFRRESVLALQRFLTEEDHALEVFILNGSREAFETMTSEIQPNRGAAQR